MICRAVMIILSPFDRRGELLTKIVFSPFVRSSGQGEWPPRTARMFNGGAFEVEPGLDWEDLLGGATADAPTPLHHSDLAIVEASRSPRETARSEDGDGPVWASSLCIQ